ncbi:hypothetical protein [Exiguobacterium artemiae]
MNRTFWINFGYIFMVPALPFLALVNGRALCSPDSPLLDIPVLGFSWQNRGRLPSFMPFLHWGLPRC